jgi:hypothetical protein
MKDGSLPFRMGDGRAAFQHVYVGNVAQLRSTTFWSLGVAVATR